MWLVLCALMGVALPEPTLGDTEAKVEKRAPPVDLWHPKTGDMFRAEDGWYLYLHDQWIELEKLEKEEQ